MNEKNLTPREMEILQLISEGCSNKQIADKLFISIDTVKKHLNNIFQKLDARNKIQAMNNWNKRA